MTGNDMQRRIQNYQCITIKGKKLSVYYHKRQETTQRGELRKVLNWGNWWARIWVNQAQDACDRVSVGEVWIDTCGEGR